MESYCLCRQKRCRSTPHLVSLNSLSHSCSCGSCSGAHFFCRSSSWNDVSSMALVAWHFTLLHNIFVLAHGSKDPFSFLRFGSRLKRSVLFSSQGSRNEFSSLCFGLGLSCYPTDCIHSRIPRSGRNMSNVAYAVQALFWSRAYCLRGSKTGRPSTKDRAG